MIKNEILNVQLPISSLDSAVRCFKLSHGKFLAQFFRCAVSVLVSLLFADRTYTHTTQEIHTQLDRDRQTSMDYLLTRTHTKN
ncbi:hypothetical protein QR98_0095010 [Sarcoptes scabiei]|uniref:Uncharacterized protein n=1 Tax=Sarcoptes scabiei TaxID=52283 RepID=A0A132AIW6_SARSC|nr:hypothetical protein QR98_0095010 [Sarcoptes scabiei]